MFYPFKKYKSLNDLNVRVSNSLISENTYKYRQQVRIAVVDDEKFLPENNLRTNNYNISVFNDLNTIEDIQNYHIILCDLSGVGTRQNPVLQGAHLIAEIKKAYPEKYVIAYTGGSSDREIYATAKVEADYFANKDALIDEWTEVLDEAIRNVANPIVVWKKLRPKLLEADVTPYELALIEHDFVNALTKNSEAGIKKIQDKAESLNLSKKAQGIITSLMADVIIKLATGGAT